MCAKCASYNYGMGFIETDWTHESWLAFQDFSSAAERLDVVRQDADCFDPEKSAWAKRVEKRLAKLEARKKRV